mgnify:CR=1 FL=1
MDKKSDKKSIIKAITRVMEKYSYKELYEHKLYSKKIILFWLICLETIFKGYKISCAYKKHNSLYTA